MVANDGDDISIKRVVIDSRDRDLSRFPSPSSYEIDMDDEMLDVESVQLLVADLPFSGYMVNSTNRLVPLRVAGQSLTVALTIGDYADAAELGAELEGRLNAACALAFVVAYLPRTDNFSVTAGAPFSMVFRASDPALSDADTALAEWQRPRPPPPKYVKGSAARLLGFGCAEYRAEQSLPASWSLVSPFRKNFFAQPYLVLRCDPAHTLTSSNDFIMDAFAILSPQQDRLSFSHRDENSAARKTFSPIIPKLRRLVIQFIDYDGNLYDCQNYEHRLELIFKSMRSYRYRRFAS